MPDDYEKLKSKFPVELRNTEGMMEEAGKVGLELPSHLDDELKLAKFYYDDVDEKLSNKKADEAIEELETASDHIDRAFSEIVKLYLAEPYQRVCSARKFFEGHEDLASQYIPGYIEHNRKFRKVRELMESNKLSSRKLSRFQVSSYRVDLQWAFNAFKSVEEELSVAIGKAEKAKWMALIGIILTCVVIILSIIGLVLMFKG